MATSGYPSDLDGATLNINIAGRTFVRRWTKTQLDSPTSNDLDADRFYDWAWDGKDAFGQPVFGDQTATVSVSWEYKPTYARTQEFGYNGGGSITSNYARDILAFWKRQEVKVQHWDARGVGLGGWDLDVHHVYEIGRAHV